MRHNYCLLWVNRNKEYGKNLEKKVTVKLSFRLSLIHRRERSGSERSGVAFESIINSYFPGNWLTVIKKFLIASPSTKVIYTAINVMYNTGIIFYTVFSIMVV